MKSPRNLLAVCKSAALVTAAIACLAADSASAQQFVPVPQGFVDPLKPLSGNGIGPPGRTSEQGLPSEDSGTKGRTPRTDSETSGTRGTLNPRSGAPSGTRVRPDDDPAFDDRPIPGDRFELQVVNGRPRLGFHGQLQQGAGFRGLRVQRVVRGTIAHGIGLEPGDLVVAINRRPVHSFEMFSDALRRSGNYVHLLVVDVRGRGLISVHVYLNAGRLVRVRAERA